uniref:SCP domain-containing protein n=1 Tax=Ananas comosus var. bracteatus TaxID=296719 RepID=A0A6V7PUW7_ANACO|nr:unnamed protein product [Ananas comosus var. bracteatus]
MVGEVRTCKHVSPPSGYRKPMKARIPLNTLSVSDTDLHLRYRTNPRDKRGSSFYSCSDLVLLSSTPAQRDLGLGVSIAQWRRDGEPRALLLPPPHLVHLLPPLHLPIPQPSTPHCPSVSSTSTSTSDYSSSARRQPADAAEPIQWRLQAGVLHERPGVLQEHGAGVLDGAQPHSRVGGGDATPMGPASGAVRAAVVGPAAQQLHHGALEGAVRRELVLGTGWDWKATDVVLNWAEEHAFYNPANNSCLPGQVCGHFTQIVWNNTERVGCARVECAGGGVIITCNYDPPGNWVGERPYELAAPGTAA